MAFRDVVYKLHDEHGLADTGTAEEADLTALAVRLKKVDDLDAGRKNLCADRELVELRSGLVNRSEILVAESRQVIDGLTDDIEQASFDLIACRDCYGTFETVDTETAAKAVGTLHCHTAHGVLTDVLLYFEYQHRTVFTVDLQGRINRGYDIVFTFEDDVDHRSDHLGYFTKFFAHYVNFILLRCFEALLLFLFLGIFKCIYQIRNASRRR